MEVLTKPMTKDKLFKVIWKPFFKECQIWKRREGKRGFKSWLKLNTPFLMEGVEIEYSENKVLFYCKNMIINPSINLPHHAFTELVYDRDWNTLQTSDTTGRNMKTRVYKLDKIYFNNGRLFFIEV